MAQGEQMVAQGRYFTIFAPRQAGKTTYFQLLMTALSQKPYTPIWISFENLATASRAEFYADLTAQFSRYLGKYGLTLDAPFTNHLSLEKLFSTLKTQTPPIVLILDEFEGLPGSVLSELMHTFRKLYHQKEFHGLQSLILIGVSTLAELVLSSASPFNVVDELRLPYFTLAEVENLIGQHVAESGQAFEAEAIRALYDNTRGQPGLVCALCEHLVEQVATDRSQPVTMAAFYQALTHFLKERLDKNIQNIIQKAREKRDFMLRLLFADAPVEFIVDDPDIAYLSAHGVIANVRGLVDIPIPLYRKRLLNVFRPLANGEAEHYVLSAQETLRDYLTPTGLNVSAMLLKYRAYVRRRGFRAFDTERLKEGAWHYSLDGFINFLIEQLGGQTFIETPTGRGRTDILILYRQQKYIIETKIFTSSYYFEKGKTQLAEYLAAEGVDDGYYVVFSSKHTEADQLDMQERINGKQIHTIIICTRFDRATDLVPPS